VLVFKNVITGKVEAHAKPAPSMTTAGFSAIEQACENGRAHEVSAGLCAIMDSQPHPGCLLVLSDGQESQ
jgi:hypothetical protein